MGKKMANNSYHRHDLAGMSNLLTLRHDMVIYGHLQSTPKNLTIEFKS